MTMEYSIFKDTIGQKGLQTYLSNRTFDAMYWPSLFPLKRVSKLDTTTLIGAKGHRVAADITAYNAPAPVKRRPTVDKMTAEIPPIRIARQMEETDLNEYYALKAQADDQAQLSALELVFDDVLFCADGVRARLEWLGLQAAMHGTVTWNATNNEGAIIQTDVDFRLPAANQEYIGSAGGTAAATHYWTAAVAATNDPIVDIQSICDEAADGGSKIQYMLMNMSKWRDLRQSTAVQNFCRTYLIDGTAYRTYPRLDIMNDALKQEGLPEIIVIDTRVYVEVAGTYTAVDPWLYDNTYDRYVTFVPELPLGNMLYCPTAEEYAPVKQAMYAKRDNILISKFRSTNPVGEMTVGQMNAFPSWPSIDKAWILNTESHTTF